MLLYMDGFDHYATADLSKKGWTAIGVPAISASIGRRGSGGLAAPNNSSVAACVTRTVGASASFVMGASVTVSNGLANAPIFSLLDAGSVQCELWLLASGLLSVSRNSGAVTGGTSALTLALGVNYYIEWKVTISDSIGANTCKVRVNGVDWITVAAGQDLKSTANASANQVRLGPPGNPGATISLHYDDFYICDQTGTTNNDFLGDVRIDTIYPTADGTYSQFTPSTGTAHYALVDETAPNTTDYNTGAAAGDRDSYALGNLSALASQTVYGVQVNAAMLKDDAGIRTAATMVRSGSTNSDGATVGLSTSQAIVSQIYETDPNGSVAWTESSVNAMEAGVKVVA